MIKEQAIDTLTLGNVSVTETDYCGGKVAVWASDGNLPLVRSVRKGRSRLHA